MPKSKGPSLKRLYIMVKCKGKTPENCHHARRRLFRLDKHILQAYTTDTVMDGNRYCVIAKALIDSRKVKSLVSNIKNQKYVENSKILIGDW